MKLTPVKGKYVVAVSGGVDSVVLLDLLAGQKRKTGAPDIVVAHFDHGIRQASISDRQFVQELATKHGLDFRFAEGHLGNNTSEQKARGARYKFLNEVVNEVSADGIITAHHQDDVIETAILNMIRGTGRKGLSSLGSNNKVLRPLLNYPKAKIISYATDNNLPWREDPTNSDTRYLRNYIRLNIIPKLSQDARARLVELTSKQEVLNQEIDESLASILSQHGSDNRLNRLWLNSLDSSLSREVLAAWLRQNELAEFDRKGLERLSTTLKTISPSKKVDVIKNWQIVATKHDLALRHVER